MKHSFPPIIFFLIFYLANPSNGMIFNGITLCYSIFQHLYIGYQIRDLYTNDATFITDAEIWTATALRNGIPYSTCDGTYIVGGYEVLGEPYSATGVQGYYFQRIYENLPDHNIIYFTISLWLIDSWDSSPPDYFQLQFDSILAEGWSFGSGNFTANYCGNPAWHDLKNMTVFGQVSHSGSSLTLRVISQLDNYAIDESLGFRDVNLMFAESTESNVNKLCGLSPIPLPSNQCDCSDSEYFDLDTSACQSCDSSCRSCFGSTAQECYDCQMGYSFVGGECNKCNENCAECSGPNVNQCTDCDVGMSLFDDGSCVSNCAMTSMSGTVLVCDQPCLIAGQYFFYGNQTCSEDCNSPFNIETLESGVLVCMNPCPEGFLYWDGTCNSLCPFPLKEEITDDDLALCLYNCESHEFLYWDGSCGNVCNDSFVASTFKNKQFCQHPCLNPADFISWNGTCQESCPFPLTSSNDGKADYCDLPCAEGQFLSQDGTTCLESCSLPLRTRELDNIIYCEFPCDSSEYLYWDGSCRDSCPSPYKISSQGHGIQFCNYLCEQYDEYYFPIKETCLPDCDAPKAPHVQIIDDQTWYVACLNLDQSVPSTDDDSDGEGFGPSNPFYFPITAIRIASEKVAGVFIALDIVIFLLQNSHAMIMVLVIKILGFIKYMDIRVPPQVVQEFKTYDHNHFYLNFGPAMSQGMREKFTSVQLPFVFERAGLHSSFLVNFFKPITSFLIMLGFMMMIAILQKVFRKKAAHQYVLVKIILRRLELFFRWNLVVLLVICNIDEVTLFGIIEWKTAKIDSAQDVISLLLSLGMVIVSLFVLVAPFYFLHRVNQTRFKVLSNQANEPYFDLLKKIERFKLLWKDFKDSSWSEKSFLPIYILRIALIYLIIALLYKYPLLQAVLLLSQSIMMLTFMSIVKPFIKTLDFIKDVIYEVCMLIVIGSVFILAVLHHFHGEAKQLWLFLGDCIMFCNICVSFTAIVFFGIKFFQKAQSLWRIYKSTPQPRIWSEFWILVLQENDPVVEELRRNKKSSSKLDMTSLEKELQMKNLASYNISFISSPDDPPEGSNDEAWLSHIPQKSELRIRKALFSMKKRSSDSESSPVKTASTFDEDKSPSSVVSNENLKLSNKRVNIDEIKKNIQASSHLASQFGNEEIYNQSVQPRLFVNEKSDFSSEKNYSMRKRFLWKGLETIKEMDSMEVSRMRSDQQTRRLGNNNSQDTLRGDFSFLNAVNKRLSSETKIQRAEEMEIIKEKVDIIKKKLTSKEDSGVQESLFQ